MTTTGPIPPGSDPDPFAGLSDEQVLELAKGELRLITSFRIGTAQRAEQWGRYDRAKAELDRRLLNHVLRKLGEKP